MNVVIDIDGTIDAFPLTMLALCSSLMAAGHRVYIVTGIEADTVIPADLRNKKKYLNGLGFGPGTYTGLEVLPQPHDKNKAKWIKENNVSLLIDNDVANAKEAKSECAVLLLWNNKVKD